MNPGRLPRVGVVGGGWAGLACAVELAQAGYRVVLWEMAPQLGGRGRSGIVLDPRAGGPERDLDCGQHLLIGAYTTTLDLLARVGVDAGNTLHRMPLQLCDARGEGLALKQGAPTLALLGAILRHPQWSGSDRLRLILTLAGWQARRFTCPPELTVAHLCRRLPRRVRTGLIDPLCAAALNTPSEEASAQVFLRVLADGLLAGPGGSDLLIPRVPLGQLWPEPAAAELKRRSAQLNLGHRVQALEPLGGGRWRVDEDEVDRLVLATSSPEAARLVGPWDAAWARQSRDLSFEPIVTTWIRAPGLHLATPMALLDGACAGPAQFAFDLSAIGHPQASGANLTLVGSAAGPALDQGLKVYEQAIRAQLQALADECRIGEARATWQIVRSVAERRATFRCVAGLRRPPMQAAASVGPLWMAGDYIEGPYPATLEGAMRSGVAAAQHVMNS